MDQPETPHAEIVEDDQLEAREALSNRLANIWWTFFLRGLLAAGVGIAALFWPTGSISLLLQLVGLLLVLDGGLTLFGLGRRGPVGSVGIGTIVIGLVLLIWPEGAARFAFVLLGTFSLITGIGSLLAWHQLPEWNPERVTARNAGFVALLIGLFLIFWPGTGLVALGWAIAFAAISLSAMMFWLATRFKGANERLKTKVINPL
ncbi:hypothetical protein DS909_09550 [Phaeobacter gallaeciensis]|uniref:HdeD family acid-resistance protein n=2 Tax=Roseobacteraceae TaxID=2854170 RepID=A0A366X512_9RHOB|nr:MULTISPECIES: DUF308 domain-containing protein [Roseobacteraceae]MBT3141340.1 DUF308 domain-containing protein [Falsiruegeria litorea]MBT8166788.1 DUF308 domain-containing protein [Falsiruegeria litorea]RBW56208.1 hypothetical protein DS909_09550 [Phaeobacter gallaeciensis]